MGKNRRWQRFCDRSSGAEAARSESGRFLILLLIWFSPAFNIEAEFLAGAFGGPLLEE